MVVPVPLLHGLPVYDPHGLVDGEVVLLRPVVVALGLGLVLWKRSILQYRQTS